MEVTRHNFVQTLPLVKEALAECTFFAFDCEMTGLFVKRNGNNNGNNKAPAFLDDIEDRYEELLESSNAFAINQFGLSAFIWNDASSSWSAKTFNFYTFPRPFEDWEPRFLSEAGSLQFLASCNFNFNKWIYDGIPYMPTSLRDSKLNALAEKKRKEDSRPDIVLTKESDVQLVENLIKQVKTWLNYGKEEEQAGEVKGQLMADDGIYSGSEGELEEDTLLQATYIEEYLQLDSVNSFQRALQYQTLRKNENFNFPDPPGFYIERVENEFGRVALKLIRASSSEIAAYEAEQQQRRIDEINTAASFCQVLEMMRVSRKPAVGHNLSFDVAYTLHSFAKPLPPTWMEFKDRVKKWFPGGMYDTKYISEQYTETLFADTSLGEVFKTAFSLDNNSNSSLGMDTIDFNSLPGVGHAIGFDRYVTASSNIDIDGTADGGTTAGGTDVQVDNINSSTKNISYAHEAGYDAYMTGSVFARFLTLLLKFQQLEEQEKEEKDEKLENSLFSLEVVDEYCWRMNVSRSDMQYAVLWGPDNVLPRKNILYITQIDPTKFRHGGEVVRKLNEVKDLVGGGYIRVSVLGEHGTAALLELPQDAVEQGGEELLNTIKIAVVKALPGSKVKDFEAYRTIKAMVRAGMDIDEEENKGGDKSVDEEEVMTVNLPAKRPRTGEPSSSAAAQESGRQQQQQGEEERQNMALQAAAENSRCSIM